MMAFRPLVLAVTVAVLVGCGSSAPRADGQVADVKPPENLDDARQLWRQSGVAHYVVTAQQTCFCPRELVQPIRLEVENGRVVAMEGLNQPLNHLSQADARRMTVEGLFEFIQKAVDRQAHKLDVSYDSEFGFPTHIDYDGHPMMADDELQFRLSDFDPVTVR
ncbi:DUF6174 domain-containing protein [Marinobacter halotolerans]|uniref:DUF6174 domain-containing protein n=1 Tax=Marinobacter halotolerans TaxID=1569211 RepID=UPI001245F55C|nr:DUF6174 domain-containing protein [Marinobacter halotolerans]